MTKLTKPGSLKVLFSVVVSKVAIAEQWTLPAAPILARVGQFPVVERKVLAASSAAVVGRSEMSEVLVRVERVVRVVVKVVGLMVVAILRTSEPRKVFLLVMSSGLWVRRSAAASRASTSVVAFW